MTIAYRIHNETGYPCIECCGQTYAEEDLCDAIWLVSRELRSCRLPQHEQIAAKRQIAKLNKLLAALRRAGT